MRVYLLGFFFMLCLSSCGGLSGLEYNPPLPAAEWCNLQPCLQLGDVVISQPSSSILVYVLALFSVWVGWYFVQTRNGQQSRLWWGISIILGGVAAFLAGTSYQAFGYEIKCAGREFCVYTSWWEVIYNLLSVAGASALLVAISYSLASKIWQRIAMAIAVLSTVAYVVVCVVGVSKMDAFLLSFELMLLFSLPYYAFLLLANVVQYAISKQVFIKQLIGAWLILIATLFAYYGYLVGGYTETLWQQGIWFSANDVLHVCMLIWMLYVYKVLGKSVVDKTA